MDFLNNVFGKVKKRPVYDKLTKDIFTNFVKVIVWQRRVGKSYFLFYVIWLLLSKYNFSKNQIFYVNKEWLDFDFIKTYQDLYQEFKKFEENLTSDVFFVWIDEIQEISWWEKFILHIFSKYPKAIIYITGSNSKLLSDDIATNLRWRYVVKEILPLTYKEYLDFTQKFHTKDIFFEYLKFGWLPAVSLMNESQDIKMDYLKWIYNTIFVKDIVEYFNIRNVGLLKMIHQYLFKDLAHFITWKNIANYLKAQGVKVSLETILNYLFYSEKSFLFNFVPRYDLRWKKILEINQKVYVNDLGIRNSIVGFRPEAEINQLLENVVYNYLKFLGYEVYVWVLYDKEIDFVAEKNWEKIYIQVAYLLNSEETIKREFENLLKIKDAWPKYVLSLDDFSHTQKYEWVIWKNLIDWML